MENLLQEKAKAIPKAIASYVGLTVIDKERNLLNMWRRHNVILGRFFKIIPEVPPSGKREFPLPFLYLLLHLPYWLV